MAIFLTIIEKSEAVIASVSEAIPITFFCHSSGSWNPRGVGGKFHSLAGYLLPAFAGTSFAGMTFYAVIASRRRSNPAALPVIASVSEAIPRRYLSLRASAKQSRYLSEIASVATLPRNDTFANHFLIKNQQSHITNLL